MPIVIRRIPPKGEAIKRPFSWWEVDIRRQELKGKVLTLTDIRTGGKVVINRGFHSVYLQFYLRPGDRVNCEGYLTAKGHIHGSGEIFFRDVPGKPSEAELEARESEAQGKAEDYWYDLE
jgi:hypothetical protein